MYQIKNWLNFQHYGDKRTPPWIKLHYELLTSETWMMIDDASKLLAIVCMMVASRNKGQIKGSPEYIQRVGSLSCIPNFKPLLDIGFLELIPDASIVLANAVTNEESESDKESKKESESKAQAPDLDFSYLLNKDFDLDRILKDDTRGTARRLAPGWDLYNLMSMFNEQVRSGKFKKPSHPDGAFLAWIPKFTKGKRP